MFVAVGLVSADCRTRDLKHNSATAKACSSSGLALKAAQPAQPAPFFFRLDDRMIILVMIHAIPLICFQWDQTSWRGPLLWGESMAAMILKKCSKHLRSLEKLGHVG